MWGNPFGKHTQMGPDIPPAHIIDDEERRKREDDCPGIRVPAEEPPEEPETPPEDPDEPPKPGSTVIKIDL